MSRYSPIILDIYHLDSDFFGSHNCVCSPWRIVEQKALVMCQRTENELMSVLQRKKRRTISMRTGTYRENMLRNSLFRFSSHSLSIWTFKSVMKKIQHLHQCHIPKKYNLNLFYPTELLQAAHHQGKGIVKNVDDISLSVY